MGRYHVNIDYCYNVIFLCFDRIASISRGLVEASVYRADCGTKSCSTRRTECVKKLCGAAFSHYTSKINKNPRVYFHIRVESRKNKINFVFQAEIQIHRTIYSLGEHPKLKS